MSDTRLPESAAKKLAELSQEIDELESARVALLKRVEGTRIALLAAGDRTTAARASIDLLCEHLADSVSSVDELQFIEDEIRQIGDGLGETDSDSAGQSFESESLRKTLDEAEQEMERLSSILVEGKPRSSRGH